MLLLVFIGLHPVTMNHQPYNPLHGITLQVLVTQLVEHFGFDALGKEINIRCFTHDPSIKSTLKFLRKTPWAREKVEQLYLKHLNDFKKTESTLINT